MWYLMSVCTIHRTETHTCPHLTCCPLLNDKYCEALNTAPTRSVCSVGGQDLNIVGGGVSQTRQLD